MLSKSATSLRPSIFAELTPQLKALGDKLIPLHIGDTYRLPPRAVREALRAATADMSDTRYFRYTHPFGRPELLEALAEKLVRDSGFKVTSEHIQMTCGATQGLAAVAQASLDPGDEVLVLCPYWPLIKGIIQTVGGKVVEADYAEAVNNPNQVLGSLLTEKTRAIYLANPNNPDGRVLQAREATALYEFARVNQLAIWNDEAYEHIVFDGIKRVSLGALDQAEDKRRVVSVFTFSKSFGLAGMRLGYVVGPAEFMVGLRRVSNHQTYNLSDLCQEAALAAVSLPLPEYRAFLEEQSTEYSQARDLLAQAFEDCELPMGGAYLFIPFASKEAAWKQLHDWLKLGVSSAPGEAFGSLHGHCLRLCFTSVPLTKIQEAVDIMKS